MKPSVFSLLAGVLYGALELNSPAPPRFALTGLLGLLAGERLRPSRGACPQVVGRAPHGATQPAASAPCRTTNARKSS
jgi:XapX domain-containing protein